MEEGRRSGEGGAQQVFSRCSPTPSNPDGQGPRTHGVLAQQVVLGVGLAAVHRPQGAEERPPARQDLGGARLHQLADGRHHLQGAQHRGFFFFLKAAFYCRSCNIWLLGGPPGVMVAW